MDKIRIFNIEYENEFRSKFHEGVDQILNEAFLANHTFVRKFENKFAIFNNSLYGLAVTNGTTALEVALRACQVENKYVIIPTNTFIATAIAVVNAGGIPIAIDIEREFYSMDPDILSDKIQTLGAKNIGAVIAVHIGGHVSPKIEDIVTLCKNSEINLIEDCAQAHGAKFKNINCGNFGRFGCFSFHTTKIMSTGEGGMVVCNSEDDFNELRSIRRFGMDLNNSIMHNRDGSNYKLGEFQGLMGCLELDRIASRIKKRREIAKCYNANLDKNKFFTFSDWQNTYSTHYKQILIPLKNTRNEVEVLLNSHNIPLTGGVYYIPIHRQNIFKNKYSDSEFPVSNKFSDTHFCPPCYPELEIEQIVRVCEILNGIQ